MPQRGLRNGVLGATRYRLPVQPWAWLLPLMVAFLVARQPAHSIQKYAGLIFAGAFILLVASRPAKSLLIWIALLPFHTVVLAALYRFGVPAALVRNLAFWKELVIIGLVLAAVRKAVREGHKPDRLDILVAIYVSITSLYLLFPTLFVRVLASPRIYVRFADWRLMNMFLILLLAMRHLRWDRAIFDRITKVVLASGGVVAGIGVFEFFKSSAWNTFAINTLHIPQYQSQIVHAPVLNSRDLRNYADTAGHRIVRVGSVMFSSLDVSFYFVFIFAVGLERMIRGKGGPWTTAVTVGSAVALLFTQTRSALIAGIIVLALALRRAPGRSSSTRVRLALLLAAGIIVLAPLAASTGSLNRVTRGDATSNQYHTEGLYYYTILMGKYPLGLGLGHSPEAGERFHVTGGGVFSENYYLQVGNMLGILNLVLFLAITLTVIQKTQRAVLPGSDGALTGAAAGAVVGLAVGAFFLHVWASRGVTWTLWSLVGVMLPATVPSREAIPMNPSAGAR